MVRVSQTRRAQKNISRNQKIKAMGMREKFGIKISQNTRQALLLEIANKNTKWAKAIAKEMEGIKRLDYLNSILPAKNARKHRDGNMQACI